MNRIALAERLKNHFEGSYTACFPDREQLIMIIPKEKLLTIAQQLRDAPDLRFDMLMDICGLDYLNYEQESPNKERFAVVYQLLSLAHNERLRLKIFLAGNPPIIDSVMNLWHSADWYEREVFDMFGIVFQGHPDLRRILTDYGFIGYPLRKDFPVSGNVEMRYDPDRGRIVYQQVSIEPRTIIPKVIRKDNRYVRIGEGGPETNEGD